jgi:broad specificity phosphatase PhoE
MKLLLVGLGQLEGGLSKKGVLQARELSNFLKNERIEVMFSSPLKRALDTATEIDKYHKIEVIQDADLKERNMGIFQGKPKRLFFEKMEEERKPFHLFIPEGGESMEDLSVRAKRFFDKLKMKYPDKTILIVSHRLLIRTLIGVILKKTLEELSEIEVPNAGIIEIDFEKSGPILRYRDLE